MGNTIPLSQARRRLGSVIASLDEPAFLSWRGRVRAVLLSVEAYNAMLDALERPREARAAQAKLLETPKDHARDERG